MKKLYLKIRCVEVADKIVQLDGVRFDNPQFSFDTKFTRECFTDKLVSVLGQDRAVVEGFYDELRLMNCTPTTTSRTTRELFESASGGTTSTGLMEPISYANGFSAWTTRRSATASSSATSCPRASSRSSVAPTA